MSEELPAGLATAKSLWIKHLKRSQDFPGSDREYCLENGLNFNTFGSYKRKLGFVKKIKPRAKTQAFKRIAVESAAPIKIKTEVLDSKSPEWIARFLKEFLK
jgi:hypothetical protein